MLRAYPADQITPRRFATEFGEAAPRHWVGGDPFLSHMLNTYTLLIPGNEAYFIRTLKDFIGEIRDPALRQSVANFMRQESHHGAAHQRHQRLLEAQGYRVGQFQRWTNFFLYKIVEPITPATIRLSIVAFVEHINAYLGHEFLQQRILDGAEPRLRALFEWHFAEEIEHKHVAYDVLQSISRGYATRIMGAVLVVPLFYFLISLGTLNLLRQDRALWKGETWRSLRGHLGSRHQMARRSIGHVWSYLQPRFHPWQLQDYELAQDVIGRYSSRDTRLLQPLAVAA